MLSLRENLTKIGILPGSPFSYCSFASRPSRFSQAIRSMDAPQNWQQVSDISLDEYWTDEVQGVAWDGHNWIFSCDANQKKPDANDKAIYVFKGGESLLDMKWISMIAYKNVPHPMSGLKESNDHWGQLTYHDGFVYVSHFWKGGPKEGSTNVVVFRDEGGHLQFTEWIELKPVTFADGQTGYVEFQAINPWDSKWLTCRGGGLIEEFFFYDPQSRVYAGKLRLAVPCFRVQGACFSPNGHLYVSVDVRLPNDWDSRWKEYYHTAQIMAQHPFIGDVETALNHLGGDHKWIFCYSALNGAMLSKIPVLAEEGGQELEGVCYGNVSWVDGKTAQIHVVLLENRDVALDNIFFKSFSVDRPELV